MSYLDNLFGPTSDRLNRSLDRTSERQSLLMKNLANVNTPGYKRQDCDFNIMLEDSMDNFDQLVANRSIAGMRSEKSSLRTDGNNVDMEYEVMSIANTETRYNTLTELTSRYFSGLKNVIREGH
ncbi:MAG: flagellar basal body rod protein FlgB [Armatimonadetes bacterium]|nr:flagellar basal body rod protein FlgB [Armatimonadota bacterium]MBS1728815.1 flagellar basal body rod protein FlgB [Armatimonadota bacterium]